MIIINYNPKVDCYICLTIKTNKKENKIKSNFLRLEYDV